MVICPDCDLVFAGTPPTEELFADAHHDAGYNSFVEAKDAANSYLESIKAFLPSSLPIKGVDAREIGAGLGALLQCLVGSGFTTVVGVETSSEATDAAPNHHQQWFVKGMFDQKSYAPDSFDLVACFMALEHVSDPIQTTESVTRLPKPGGIFCTVTHDYRIPVKRLRGRKLPIGDIEHPQLFSKKSMREILMKSGFQIEFIGYFSIKHSLSYWIRPSPLPKRLTSQLILLLKVFKGADFSVKVSVGNTMSLARKPHLT